MRIPLDLYQILGVSIQATQEQIEQAYCDRCQQLPRQEYSEVAIAARTQLLEDAYSVLSDSELRSAYNKNILADPQSEPDVMDGMELQDNQLVGALLLLQEQSEYEMIAQLGETYLKRSVDLNRVPSAHSVVDADVILAMGLANLEAGREHWQQKQFENASHALQSGLTLLKQEDLFPAIQQEMEIDLYKLRPYYILELLALPEANTKHRREGLALLQAMLDDRGGIDGQQDDLSGLAVDDFLKFVQQLRSHLTVAEQETLFAKEAKRPSAVATYLFIYALIAKGFSQGQPAFIQQAKVALTQLANRQDIYVEKAMCDLLLGQPAGAIQSLPLSRDQSSLEFIQQYSEGSADLIPGLFLYTERWLQEEVYPYFRELVNKPVSLQDYFNDEEIQTYLTQLEPEPVSPRLPTTTKSTDLPLLAKMGAETTSAAQEGRFANPARRQGSNPRDRLEARQPVASTPAYPPSVQSRPQTTRATLNASSPQSRTQSRSAILSPPHPGEGSSVRTRPTTTALQGPPRQRTQASFNLRQWLPWLGALVLGLLGIAGLMALSRYFSEPSPIATAPTVSPSVTPSAVPSVSSSAPPSSSSSADTPTPVASPSPAASPTPSAEGGKVSKDEAETLIKSWQTIKGEALGKGNDSSKLKDILAEPALLEWQSRVKSEQSRQSHWQYDLSNLTIDSVKQNGPDQLTVEATVKETAKVYTQDKLSYAAYTDDTYKVSYKLVRQAGQWKIKEMDVL